MITQNLKRWMNNYPIHVLILIQSHGDGSEELALVVQLNVADITGVAFAPKANDAHILVVVIVQGLHGRGSDKKYTNVS